MIEHAAEHSPTTQHCIPQEVVANFKSLLSVVDFTPELRMFKVGFFDVSLRNTLLKELEATYIGLWSLALERSFPDNGQEIFNCFLENYTPRYSPKQRNITIEKIRSYRDMMLSVGDQDFSQVSRHLLSFAKIDDSVFKAETLRLSLMLRNHYVFIFERLV